MIYIEYISRKPWVDIHEFHQAVATGQEGWDGNFAEDVLVWNAGRTWRMGPEPEYIAIWYTPKATGFERIDDWDRIFRSGEADPFEDPFRKAARIDMAGCYDALIEPVTARNGVYYAEFFRPTGRKSDIQAFYQERRDRHPAFTLNFLLTRIGKLGPEPGGLAVWTIPDHAALAEIARELDEVRTPVELVQAGTYRDVGQEIL